MIGEQVNNYQIVSILGEGGMGSVYLAEHSFMGRKAAIKVLRRELAEDRGLVERFMNEARAANAIRHPNIIDIIDVGQLPSGIPYLMMELLEGESLAKRIERDRPLAVAEALDVATQTASALLAAHEKGIVHRDLKPDNLFLIPDGGRPFPRVKVLDFGIAKLRGELSGTGAKTQSGSIMGTPPYMSPEQCRGISDDVDQRTDVYALGIILYEMLTGTPPFVSAGWGEVVHMHISEPPPPPRTRNPAIPVALEAIILKALAKQPGVRWSSMAEIGAALRSVNPGAAARGKPRGPAATSAVSGTAILSATTLRASTGQFDTEPGDDPSANRGAPIGRPWWRRPGAIAFGSAALVAIAAVGVVAQHSSRPATSPAEIPRATAARDLSPGAAASRPATAQPAEKLAPTLAPVAAQPAENPGPTPAPAAVRPAERLAPTPATTSVRPAFNAPAEAKDKREALRLGDSAAAKAQLPRESKPVHPKKLARRTPPDPAAASSTHQPRAKPSCDPNFYLDGQGDKHFKPECF